ncbi:hypothetical protein F5146DRAFT_1144849 [Armillaria mellea]|nr:hypothetical protein F5146DRAFT_1144849 [Armillaria mellea]
MLKEYFVVTNDSTSLFVRRSDVTRYQDLVNLLVGFFPSLNSETVIVQMNELDICAGRYVNIPPDLWPEMSPQIKNIEIISRPTQKCPTPQLMMIHIQTSCGDTESVSVPASASIYNLKTAILQKEGTPLYRQLLTYHGQSLQDDSNLSDHGISDQATIHLQQIEAVIPGGMLKLRRRRGMRGMRKPVIYLFSPRPIHSTVRVSLVKAWSFSVVYPSVPVKDTDMGQTIRYSGVKNRTKLSNTRGNEYSSETQVMSEDVLNNENSVVLRTSQAAEYLDKALSALCLHIEARTSFITYWLPEILEHDYVALRFLPQASYEHAAPLEVEPKPDVVTRVFMLFTRVCEDELVEWEGALTRAFENVDIWKGIVGVDGHKAKDNGLFRVLEWGGMEVVR